MTYYCIICNGEPSTWSVCSIPDINSREAAEILKQQIISNQEIVQQFRNYYKSNRNTMSLGLRVTFEEILEGKK